MSSQSHFFVESGGFTQSQQQAFGPQSSTEFNLTSKFTLDTPKKAYAICKGVVLVQPQTGSTDKVNLILRPYKQPFPGLNIKYFIYRGLQRGDFFTTDSNPKIIQKTVQTSDFINKINDDFDAFHGNRKDAQNNPIPKPNFVAKYIGYNEEVTDLTIPLSSFFFKESEFVEANNTFDETDDFELPMIDMGKSLGKFDQGEGGIDVVLNYGDYKHDFNNGEFDFNLEYARKAFASILVTGDTPYKQKLQREQSVQFIDIAAFYGLFVPEYAVDIVSAGTQTTKRGVEIFNSIINNFFTKNSWYIYIQSDRTRSYDFYGNYKIEDTSENLKTGLLANSEGIVPMTAVTYGTDGWPVLIDKQEQANTVTTNNLYLQFTTDNNNNTAFYGQIATVANAQKDSFINADGLRIPPDEEGNYSDLTTQIQLTTPAVQGKNIAALTILLYQGKINTYIAREVLDEEGNPAVINGVANYFDDVFSLIKAEPLLKLNGDDSYSRITSEKLNLINEFYDKKQQGISIVQTLTVNDVIETGVEETPTIERVTYLTEAGDVMNNAVSAVGSITPDTKTTASASGAVTKNKTYQLPDPYYYNLKLFTDSTQTITGLELKTLDGSTPNKIILGLTKEENDTIKALITDNIKNPRLFLIDLFEDDNDLISPENIIYQKYKVAIVAENENGDTELFEPINDVFVYSLDINYHFSKGYSEYVKEDSKKELMLDLDLSV
ncbi:hypothetical protein [Flavobacterium defluvii]|uniref:Uncharacterized protein n=1 Tax=Flavobacterium defluvii TaxID=370979 RepID=A0A1M5RKR9_9FLAO|nr:hypothetical protein [Flavobacterium defluvii]SHH26927.1 hypothetical protein SAMN05443663_106246 [Flavobacterium defluvii]